MGSLFIAGCADETAELDYTLEGLDIDLSRLQSRFTEDRRLHLAGDHGVVDILSGAFVFGSRGAAQCERHEEDGRYGCQFASDVCHAIPLGEVSSP